MCVLYAYASAVADVFMYLAHSAHTVVQGKGTSKCAAGVPGWIVHMGFAWVPYAACKGGARSSCAVW